MNLLCVDTSTADHRIGLFQGGALASEVRYTDQKNCLVNLAPSLQLTLQNAQQDWASLTGILLVNGPGAWSSLRIGVAAVKQLCLVNRLPLLTVSNNDLLAQAALMEQNLTEATLITAINASYHKVYTACYQVGAGQVSRSSSYAWLEIAQMAGLLDPLQATPLLLVSDSAQALTFPGAAGLAQLLVTPQQHPRYYEFIWALANQQPWIFDPNAILTAKPLYIQPSSAEVEFKINLE